MNPPLRIVLDTNVLVSGLIKRVSPPGQILTFLSAWGEWVKPTRLSPSPAAVPDPSDLPFAEAALAGNARVLITGNPRHFAFLASTTVQVQTPAEFLHWFNQIEG